MSLSSQHVWEGLINAIRNWRVNDVNMEKEKIIATCRWYDFYLEKSEKLAKKISKFKTKYWSQWIFLYISSHSVKLSHSVMSDYLRPHGLQHATRPCPSPTPWACSNSCPLSQWCHPTISSSVIPFSSCLQTFPSSQSFLMSQFFTSGGQSIGVSASASVLPMNIQDWFPLGWTCWISLQSKKLSRVFSNTIVQKDQFFGTQLSFLFFHFYG